MAPAGGTMLGMGRNDSGEGKLDAYELLIIRAKDGRVDYEAHPMMQPTAVFTATVVSDTPAAVRESAPRLPAPDRLPAARQPTRWSRASPPDRPRGDQPDPVRLSPGAVRRPARHSPKAVSASE